VLGLGPAGAALVRPDGVPIASWWAADVVDVERAIDALLTAPTTAPASRSAA
jgi:hypothetical protein